MGPEPESEIVMSDVRRVFKTLVSFWVGEVNSNLGQIGFWGMYIHWNDS